MQHFAELFIASVLLAGLYAAMAFGLGLIYGVLRIVNLAHGGVIMAGAYAGWWLHSELGIDPYISLVPVAAIGTRIRRSKAITPNWRSRWINRSPVC